MKLWLLLIILLTAYAPLELTRVIIKSFDIYPQDVGEFVAELSIFWTLYCVGIGLVYRLIRKR